MSDLDSKKNEEPEDLLSSKRRTFWRLWKRRALLGFALLLLLVPLYGTFKPLFEFILFAVSLAALTYPVFFRPIERWSIQLLSGIQDRRRSEICAVLSTILLLLCLLSPIFLLLWEASDAKRGMADMIWSLALGEEQGRAALLESVSMRVKEMRSIYPRLPVDEEKAVQFVANILGDTREFSGSFMEFLFKGTRGFVA